MAFDDLDDQQLVNLICELRPAAQTAPIGVDLEPVHVEWDRLRAAQDEIAVRGWVEHSGTWLRESDDGSYLIHRPGYEPDDSGEVS